MNGRFVEPDMTEPLAPQFADELPGDRMPLTTDSAANMIAFADSKGLFTWLPCICHLLNTAVTKALEESRITTHIAGLRALSKHLKRSHKAWEAFRECQNRVLMEQQRQRARREGAASPPSSGMCSDEEDYGDANSDDDVAPLEDDPANGVVLPTGDRYTADQPKRVLRLGGWCKTRWNSTFFLIKRALMLEKSINMFTRELRPSTSNKLTREQIDKMTTSHAAWSSLKQVIRPLEYIREVSERLEGDNYVTISDVLLLVLRLVHDRMPVTSELETTAPVQAQFVEAFKKKLTADIGSDNHVYDYALAAALDGRRSSLHWMRRIFENPEYWPEIDKEYRSLEGYRCMIREQVIGLVSPIYIMLLYSIIIYNIIYYIL